MSTDDCSKACSSRCVDTKSALARYCLHGCILGWFVQTRCSGLASHPQSSYQIASVEFSVESTGKSVFWILTMLLWWLSCQRAQPHQVVTSIGIISTLLYMCCFFCGVGEVDPCAYVFAASLFLPHVCWVHSFHSSRLHCWWWIWLSSLRVRDEMCASCVLLGLVLPSAVYLLDWNTSCSSAEAVAVAWKLPPVPTLLGGCIGAVAGDVLRCLLLPGPVL